MIVKDGVGSFFNGLMNYLTGPSKNHIMIGDSMGDVSKELQLSILNDAGAQNRRLKKKVFHASISMEHTGKLTQEQWKKIGDGYMNYMGFENAPYAMILHDDKDHQHIHIIGSRVDYDGKTISVWQSHERGMAHMREIEKEYGLQQLDTPDRNRSEKSKTSKEIHAERRGEKLIKTRIKDEIKSALKKARGKTQREFNASFANELSSAGVNFQTHKHDSGHVYGMSYDMNGMIFTASKLGKRFQYKQLNEQLKEAYVLYCKEFLSDIKNWPEQLVQKQKPSVGPIDTILSSGVKKSKDDEYDEDEVNSKKKRKRRRGI